MAVFDIIVGQQGSGKSLYTAYKIDELIRRNKKWFKKTGIVRKVAVNMHLSEDFWLKNGDFLVYWSSWEDLLKLRDCDIVWDEISILLDARKYTDLTIDQLHWIAHYRKFGLEIYANTQDYSMVDRRARLAARRVVELFKFLGSPDPSATRPKIKNVWGLVFGLTMINHRDESSVTSPEFSKFPSEFFFITKFGVDLYDTRFVIDPKDRPLKHVERHCIVCGKVHITHH